MRFKDGEAQDVERLRRVPAVLGAVDADEEDAVGDTVAGSLGRLAQALDAAFHAAPSFSLRSEVAVELAEQGIAVFFGPVGQVLDEVLDLLAGCLAQAS